MRYLVFGDVHGNLLALQKMLKEEQGNFDVLISHGDVVNYGPWSNECVYLLQNINFICLKGNHEEYFINGFYDGANVIPKTFFEVCHKDFSKKEIISLYKNEYEIPGFKIVHTINNQYVFPDTDVKSLHIDEDTIIGHSHHQFLLQVNNCKLYNTGSVGQNRKYINVINYLLVEDDNVELRSKIYDVDIVINEMKKRNFPSVCLDYYLKKDRA